jgi:hypothetical protein
VLSRVEFDALEAQINGHEYVPPPGRRSVGAGHASVNQPHEPTSGG